MSIRLVLLGTALAMATPRASAFAQCPDGTPMPCDVVTRAARPRPQPPPAAERGRRFLVLPFRNLTRSPEQEWLVEGSPSLLADALRQFQEISVVPDERMYPALRRFGLTPGAVPDLARVRRVAEETGGWTAVVGEVVATPQRVEVRARAYDMATEQELAEATEDVAPRDDIRTAYNRIGTALLRLAGADTTMTPDIAAGTTRSLDAYRAYLRGLAHMSHGEVRKAQEDFQEAVRRDDAFAQAYAGLATATVWVRPLAVYELHSPFYQSIERAAAHAARLPPHDRQLLEAFQALAQGRLGDARQALARLVAADSSDVWALQFLGELEFYDPILVPRPGGERPRGSLNAAVRLAKQVLDLDSTQHIAYQLLARTYLLAAGGGQGVTMGFGRERPLTELVTSRWGGLFASLLKDSIEFMPAESLSSVPHDSLAAYRRAALAVAHAWVERWIAAAPGEAEAHLTASYVYETAGEPDSALRALERASALGIETGLEHVPLRRLALLIQAGRRGEALRLADYLFNTMTPGDLSTTTPERVATVIKAMGSLLSLFLVSGRDADAGRLLGLVGRRLGGDVPALRYLFSSAPYGNPGFAVPSRLRVEAAESLMGRASRKPPGGTIGWLLPNIVELAMGNADAPDASRLAASAADVAVSFAERGAPDRAMDLAVVAAMDSLQQAHLDSVPWYREGVGALRRAQLETQQRMSAASASVSEREAVVEWRVQSDTSFTWNRPGVKIGNFEHVWIVSLGAQGSEYLAAAMAQLKEPGPARTGSLAKLLDAARPSGLVMLHTTGSTKVASADSIVSYLLTRPHLRTEVTATGFRMVLTDSALVTELRRVRPAEAHFKFWPCAHDPDNREVCLDERIPVSYP